MMQCLWPARALDKQGPPAVPSHAQPTEAPVGTRARCHTGRQPGRRHLDGSTKLECAGDSREAQCGQQEGTPRKENLSAHLCPSSCLAWSLQQAATACSQSKTTQTPSDFHQCH